MSAPAAFAAALSMPSLGAGIRLPPAYSLCGRSSKAGSSSCLLTLLETHVTTHRIPLEHAAKWSPSSTLCDEPQKPRVYGHRSGHHVLPDNLA